ncbi:uncharacterized protein LOC114948366 [Acropora millepora]|uniref:uncharacterized protein LOC114948366 n=1 Tax=Acropora millepora TaxID=45264 RepID=UPI001CF2BF28|nr:uncharacterized protein LOC114948366 [Acropora millepora]
MSATASLMGVLLKSKSIEATISRFSKLKLTNSNPHILATLDKLGENHDLDLVKAKERICQDTKSLKQAQAMHTPKEKYDHGFSKPGLSLGKSMVENRVSGVHLDSLQPKANLQDVSNLKFIPSIKDQQQQRTNYIILTSRILVQYFKVLEPLKEACIQHIPHKYMAEMSQKSKKTPLGIIFKNENVNEDMLAILQQFHSYLPQSNNGDIDTQLFSGDQLTVERAVNVISSVANGLTPQDRLDGIILQLGAWHAAVKLLSVCRTLTLFPVEAL